MHFLLVLISMLLSFRLASGTECFNYDKDHLYSYPDNVRCPGSNACCGSKATCMSNKLCHLPQDPENLFVRGPCRVSPWDGTCAEVCLYSEVDENGTLPRVLRCADGSFCCDNDPRCCSDGNGVFLDENGKLLLSKPSTSATYKSLASTESNPPPTTTPPATPTTSGPSTTASVGTTPSVSSDVALPSQSDDTKVLKVGLGVGIPLSALIAGCAIAYLLRWRRRPLSRAEPGTAPPRLHLFGLGSRAELEG